MITGRHRPVGRVDIRAVGITTVVLMQSEPVPVAVAAGFGVGMLVGAINGVLVVYARLVPFIVTLARTQLRAAWRTS